MKSTGGFMFTKDDCLKALYSDELETFLDRLGLLIPFEKGQLKCRYCGTTISKNSLYAIVPYANEIEFCCNQPQCVIALAEEASK